MLPLFPDPQADCFSLHDSESDPVHEERKKLVQTE